ncbi:MAG: polyphosphate kinase 1 [Longimicrobiales bacterium]
MTRRLNFAVADEAAFLQLAASRRPFGMAATPPAYHLLRETYFDTVDGALSERRMTLALRLDADGRQTVELVEMEAVNLTGVVEQSVYETAVEGTGLYATLAGPSEVATRVRAVVEPEALRPQIALDLDRESRELKSGIFGRPTHRLTLDEIVAQAPGVTRALREVTITELAQGGPGIEVLAAHAKSRHGLHGDGSCSYERVKRLLTEVPEGLGVDATQEVRVALLLIQGWSVALLDEGPGLTLPLARGSGEDLAREYLAEVLGADASEGADVDLVGFATPRKGGFDTEVWLHEVSAVSERPRGFVWLPLLELLERIGAPRLRDPGLVATLLMLVRSETGVRLLRDAPSRRGPPQALPLRARLNGAEPGEDADDLLDLDLSILDFNVRVLEMAEDSRTPLLERLKFLSIFSSNMDEFFVVRVARIKEEIGRGTADEQADFSPTQLLGLVGIRVRALIARGYACFTQLLLPELAAQGVHLRRWNQLQPAQRDALERRFTEEIFPVLTPLKLSASAVRSFPRLVSLGLALAAVLRRPGEARTDLGYVAIPHDLPRFLNIPDSKDVIAIEDVIIANADELFAGEVEDAHTFRASRTADVEVDEDSSGSLLEAVADEVERRPYNPVIRVEVEASMPRELRAYLLKEIRAEQGGEAATLTRSDIYEVDGLLDLRRAGELCDVDVDGGRYEPHTAIRPLAEHTSIFDALSRGDILVHHPFHDFDSTVGRFLSEAAADPEVVSIKLTLYRTGRRSPVMEALLQAVEAGKDVAVFVELKARFDEESNIEWTHRLKEAGANVVTGVLGFKTHAKTALVVRREEQGLRRYVHIGTGNYNAQTSRFYTDFGLMSANPDLGADLHDFFNELTGSELPPGRRFRRLLVAPNSLVQELERMIEREAEHARAGRPARIQAKLNGLADRKIVLALYRAAQAGVDVDLVVRSICTLRPGTPGLSERIHVRSILGRLLEHSRIYFFENGGHPEYYIGSADWRARNLRKRVEVVTPVDDAAARAVLRAVLDAHLADPCAWVLRPDGAFECLGGEGPSSQELLMSTAGRGHAAIR